MEATAKATRSGDWWAIEVPEVPGLYTQARRLDQVQALVIEAAALLGIEVDSVAVEPVLSSVDAKLVAAAARYRTEAQAAEAEASRASRAVVDRLRSEGFTVRDVATVLGVSPQRISAIHVTQRRSVYSQKSNA